MADPCVERLASVLVGYSADVQPGELVTIEGPLECSLESLGAALHLAFFLSHDTGNSNALVGTYRDRRPELFPLAATLIDLRPRARFEDALVALDESSHSY